MLNNVVLIGFVSRPPRRVGDTMWSFPLAVYRDEDRNHNHDEEKDRDVPDFPPVIVMTADVPPYVRHKARVRVEGWLRTRNRTMPLYKDVQATLLKAGVDESTANGLVNNIPRNLTAKHVEIEVVAERIFLEGERKTQ